MPATDYSRISTSSLTEGQHHREASAELHPASTSPLLDRTSEDDESKYEGGSASVLSGVSNLANTILGTGCLAFPSVFSSVGILPGIVTCAFSGFMSFSGLYLLSCCASHVVPRRTSSFNAISLLTFGAKATIIFDLAIAIKCFGVSVSYLIIIKTLSPPAISTIYHILFPNSTPPSLFLSGPFWLLISFTVNIPLSFMRQLNSLRFTSQAALLFVIYLLAIVVVFLFHRPHDIEPAGEIVWARFHHDSIGGFPIQIFAFTCAQNLFPVYNELINNTPARIHRVTSSAIFSAVTTYEIIGLAGYLTFGNKVTSNILSSYPNSSLFVALGRLGIVVMVAFSYPLQAHPCRASLDKVISTLVRVYRSKDDPSAADKTVVPSSHSTNEASTNEEGEGLLAPVGREDSTTGEIVLEVPEGVVESSAKPMAQTRFVALTCCILLGGLTVALLIDDLEVVLSFVGATGSTTISFVLPGLFYFKLYRHKSGSSQALVWSAFALACYGICVMIFCLTYNIVTLTSGSGSSH